MFMKVTKIVNLALILIISFMNSGAVYAKAPATITPETVIITPADPEKKIPAEKASAQAEDWKGPIEEPEVRVGVLMGLGILDSSGGATLLGTISRKIVTKGFAPEINNCVSIEGEAGPISVLGNGALAYSAHLRWDFQKNDEWTFYALGGVGGNITGAGLGNRFLLFPRFGVGAFWTLNEKFALRGELSHELTAIGVSFNL